MVRGLCSCALVQHSHSWCSYLHWGISACTHWRANAVRSEHATVMSSPRRRTRIGASGSDRKRSGASLGGACTEAPEALDEAPEARDPRFERAEAEAQRGRERSRPGAEHTLLVGPAQRRHKSACELSPPPGLLVSWRRTSSARASPKPRPLHLRFVALERRDRPSSRSLPGSTSAGRTNPPHGCSARYHSLGEARFFPATAGRACPRDQLSGALGPRALRVESPLFGDSAPPGR